MSNRDDEMHDGIHEYGGEPSNKKKWMLITGTFVFLLVCIGVFVLFFLAPWDSEDDEDDSIKQYQKSVTEILDLAMKDTQGYQDLTTMVNTFGNRMSGSATLDQVSAWAKGMLEADGFENVRYEDCMIPAWKHNPDGDLLEMTAPYYKKIGLLALGLSIAADEMEGEVVVLTSFDDLETVDVKDKIVLWNVPFTTYGQTVPYRTSGAMRASAAGAKASLTRSVASYSLFTPHTGVQFYGESTPIPTAAIAVEDAELMGYIQNTLKEKIEIKFTLDVSGKDDLVPGQNVIGELPGNDPENDEILVIGGHIDSWDVGTGAHDDAGGIWHCWEAMRILKNNGFIPKRTIRLVMWTSEEFGGAGSTAYYEAHKDELDKTVFALESDIGTLTPVRWDFQGNESAIQTVQQIADLMKPTLKMEVVPGGAGADVEMICENGGVPGVGLKVEGDRPNKYFWFHHTNADTIDHIDENDFRQCVGAVASMIYVIADMEGTLPRTEPVPVTPKKFPFLKND